MKVKIYYFLLKIFKLYQKCVGITTLGTRAIILNSKNEILLVKHTYTPGWHFPGGGVDKGESPRQAIIREVKEELNLTLSKEKLQFIGKKTYNHHLKNRIDRSHLYAFAACMPRRELDMQRNPEETSVIFMTSEAALRRALRTHRIKHFGRLSPMYAYWRFLLDGAFPPETSKHR